jgi:hypothetical protein
MSREKSSRFFESINKFVFYVMSREKSSRFFESINKFVFSFLLMMMFGQWFAIDALKTKNSVLIIINSNLTSEPIVNISEYWLRVRVRVRVRVRGVPTGWDRGWPPRIIENFVFFLENFQKILKRFAKIGGSPQ